MALMRDPDEGLLEEYGDVYNPQTAPAPAPAPAPVSSPLDTVALPTPQPTTPQSPLDAATADRYAWIANAPTMDAQVDQAWAEAMANPLIMQGLAAQGITSKEGLRGMFAPSSVPGVQFTTNAGRPAGIDGGDPYGYVPYDPNGAYRLIDKTTGKVVYEGTGYAGLDEAQRIAAAMSASGGTGASWALEAKDPATGQYTLRARDEPKSQVGGMIADVALPAFLAAVAVASGGTLAPLMTALYAGGGSAMGSALSSAIQGRPFDEALLRAGISGVLAGAGAYAAPGLSNALTSALGSVGAGGAGGALPAGITQAMIDAGEVILVNGTLVPAAIAGGVGGSIGGGLTGQALTDYIAQQTSGLQQPQVAGPNDVLVTGTPLPTAPNPGVGLGGLPPPLPGEYVDPEGITVEGTRPTNDDNTLGGVVIPPSGNVSPPTADDANEIIVRNHPPTQDEMTPPVPTFPAGLDIGNPATSQEIADATTPEDPSHRISMADIGNYLQLAGLVSGLGGSLLGGGGGGAGIIRNAGNIGNLPPSFHAPLPSNPVIPGTGGMTTMPERRAMPAQDWELYGTRPQQSWFTGSNSRYTPPAPGIFDQWGAGTSRGYAGGGRVAEGGPLTLLPGLARGGRADDVPAMLSDGEYVIDAETVALLGDGSFDEGSRKLDSLRVNIRKHKGRQLAKGKISPPAKSAERYLGGK